MSDRLESWLSGYMILRWCAVNNADGDLNIHKMVLHSG
jgi:hypothetical protein